MLGERGLYTSKPYGYAMICRALSTCVSWLFCLKGENMELVNFDFEGLGVRTIEKEGQVWFVAKDICSALNVSDSSQALARLDNDERGWYEVPTPGGRQEMIIINESGLYSLILSSRKPEAKVFKKWVTSEVLPAIRKTGSYSVDNQPPKQQAPHLVELSASIAKSVFPMLEMMGIDRNSAAIGASQAGFAVTGFDVLKLSGVKLLSENQTHKALIPTKLGELVGLTAIKMNQKLQSQGYQTKTREEWVPTDLAKGFYRLVDSGKKRSSGKPITQIEWYTSILEELKLK